MVVLGFSSVSQLFTMRFCVCRAVLAAFVLFLLEGCLSPSSTQPLSSPASSFGESSQSPVKRSQEQIDKRLMQHYREWKGTPYRWGGQGRNGVDCSGFVHLSFAKLYRMQLPRTTTQQFKVGRPVQYGSLSAGDLVFFSNDDGGLHVGIYVSDGEFLHASTSRGVRMSEMQSGYWRQRFLSGRRAL